MQNLQIEKASDSKTEFWGICCETGKRYSQIVGKKFHISMAALDPTDTSTSAVVSLMAEHDGCQYLLCSLKKDSILQVLLNLYFDKGENITFFLKGHGTVHLSGYYVCDTDDGAKNLKNDKKAPLSKAANKGGKADFTVSANVESSDEEASDESEKATVKVSPAKASPVAAKGVLNNKSKLPKAIANEEESSEDDSMEEDDDIPKQKLSTSPVKKPQGKALPGKKSQGKEESSSDEDLFDDDDFEDDDDEEDEEESEEEDEVPSMKRGHSAVESSDAESDEDSDESEDSKELKAGINKIKKQLQQKKLKSGASTPVQNNKGGKKSITNNGEPDLNSSIGRTPMPKKVKSNLPLDEFLSEMKQQSKSPKKDSLKSEEANTSASKTPEKSSNDLNTSAQSESAKKKKNKKKAKEASENQNTPNKTPAKQQFSQKLPGGIEYEDIRPGNGLVAKKGKLVHVYYTGQLENNKVFDSVKQGQKPFSFKLAAGQVIKGWDLGIEGMKVGGKRRLKVPPNMGYGNKKTGPIPPNSNLYFTVELKAVS